MQHRAQLFKLPILPSPLLPVLEPNESVTYPSECQCLACIVDGNAELKTGNAASEINVIGTPTVIGYFPDVLSAFAAIFCIDSKAQ